MLGRHFAIQSKRDFFLFSGPCRTRTHEHRKMVEKGVRVERSKEGRKVCYLRSFSNKLLSDFFPFFLTSFRSFCFFPTTHAPSATDFFPLPNFFPAGKNLMHGSIGSAFRFVRRLILFR